MAFDGICVADHMVKETPFAKIKRKSEPRGKQSEEDQDNEVEIAESDRAESYSHFQGHRTIDEGPASIVFDDLSDSEKVSNTLKTIKRRPLVDSEDVAGLLKTENLQELPKEKRARLVQMWLGIHYRQASSAFTKAANEYHDICQQIQDRNKVLYLEILKQAKVVGMTTTGAAIHQDLLITLQPSVVIVEEASEVLEAQLLATLTPSVKHLIMIGDHRQLRPIVACHELARFHYFDRSMFERLVTNGHPHVTLSYQRRMKEDFVFLLRPFYSSLLSNPEVKTIQNCYFLPRNLFFWSMHSSAREGRLRGGSFSNTQEAGYVKQLVLFLLSCGVSENKITVLAPYLGQVHLILKYLQNCKDDSDDENVMNAASKVKVSTVDHYQGEENEIIILSLVRSNKQSSFGFLNDSNRFVVAISRQKSTLIIVGNSVFFKHSKNWGKLIGDLNSLELVDEKIPIRYPLGFETQTIMSEIDLKRALMEKRRAPASKSSLSPQRKSLEDSAPSASVAPSIAPPAPTINPFSLTEKFLQRLAAKLGKHWQSLATELGLQQHGDIDGIEYENPNDLGKQAFKALLKWKQKNGGKAQREQLIEALVQIGRKDLADELDEIYMSTLQ
eukprot:m.55349 g.55349  ORF g.55349 m.55349 type:complete len:614 (+) comp34455_c0_seq6:2613-4454(+)